jgi:outer membrane protein OmpA-like peptidoglycan-associated protein
LSSVGSKSKPADGDRITQAPVSEPKSVWHDYRVRTGMEIRPMSAHVTPRPWSLRRAFTQALLLGLIPLGTASAQPYGFVRVTHDRTNIECFGRRGAVCMTASKGTVLEVLFTDGSRYDHRKSNRYWILLPPDRWGRRVTGWIRGNAVEHIQPPPLPAAKASLTEVPRELDKRHDTPMPAPVGEVPAARPVISNIVVNFEFGKSTLTDEARRKLDRAILRPAPNVQGLAVELEGHADWIGPEAYNEQLGLARAETVKRYLTEQLQIPAERISVISYGERNPVAPNTTREGRAQNRRVVVKGDGS